jgi:hypothetical protein
MKRFYYISVLLLVITSAQSQIHELGIFAGGSNFIGDVGKTDYISPNKFAFGALYKWNKSPRFSWRFSIMHSTLKANDADSEVSSRIERGYVFENTVTDLTAGFEFNFSHFNLHESGFKATPYVHMGLSYFLSEQLYVDQKQYKKDGSSRTGGIAIPMVVGYKFRLTDNFILGLETGARYTFKDDIDGSYPKNNELEGLKFGNLNSNDWYVFTGATLTYTFGIKPCYCKE